MKAIRLYDIHDLRLETVGKPTTAANGVRLLTARVGICGSDIHYYQEGGTGSLQFDHPLILGHEFSARIDEGSKKGRLVAADRAVPCGCCEFCLEGNSSFCADLVFAGAEDADGALQEFINWPKSALFPLSSEFTPEEGRLLEPLSVAIHALKLDKVSPSTDLGVFDAEPIGLLTTQLAKLAGASHIFANDTLTNRLEVARSMGRLI